MCVYIAMHIDPPKEYYWTPQKAQPTANEWKAQLHRTLLVFDSSVNRAEGSWYGLTCVAATKDVKTVNLYTLEAINHPFRKENHLPNLHDYVPC